MLRAVFLVPRTQTPTGAFLPPPTGKRSKSHLPELPQDAGTTSATRDSHPQPASSSYQPDLGVRCKSQDIPPALQLETQQGSSSFTGQLLGLLCHPTCSQIGSTCWQKAPGQDQPRGITATSTPGFLSMPCQLPLSQNS